MQNIKIDNPLAGVLWFAGWLFTAGYAHLSFWQFVLAILMWPYYLGSGLAAPQ